MTRQHTPFLENIYQTCRDMGLVSNQYEFSTLCGRKTSWFSAAKARDQVISTHAAYMLAIRLKQMANTDLPKKLRPHANALSALLFAVINDRARRDREGQ
jgi:hypothetical protein